jgi:hypothetical protein
MQSFQPLASGAHAMRIYATVMKQRISSGAPTAVWTSSK